MTATAPAIITRSADAPLLRIVGLGGALVVVGEATLPTVVAVDAPVEAELPEADETPDEAADNEDTAELAAEVTEAELPDEAEEAEEVALGVLKEEMIPLLLTG